MTIKRAPDIPREFAGRYAAISKADLVEAFRDLFREAYGREFDDTDWIVELEHRVEIVRRERKYTDMAKG